jgi:hypothetical protein
MGVDEEELPGPVQDAEAVRHGRLSPVAAQQVGAQGMQGGDLHQLDVGLGQLGLDAVFEFQGGLVGEGGDQQVLRPGGPGAHQVRHPPGDDLGLARAGTGDNQQRAIPVGDSLDLLPGQARRKIVRPVHCTCPSTVPP